MAGRAGQIDETRRTRRFARPVPRAACVARSRRPPRRREASASESPTDRRGAGRRTARARGSAPGATRRRSARRDAAGTDSTGNTASFSVHREGRGIESLAELPGAAVRRHRECARERQSASVAHARVESELDDAALHRAERGAHRMRRVRAPKSRRASRRARGYRSANASATMPPYDAPTNA